jgi:hypothetical protein
VHFYIDGPAGAVPIAGIITADIERPDVNQVTGYPGNHGFSFSIPAQYRDGNTHTIYAYGIDLTGDLNKPLGGNPKTFTLSPLVKNVSFQQIATDDLPINANPNVGDGLRIFPDDKDPNDQTDRRIIRVKAQSSVRTAGIRIYFRNYDLDDPSSDVAPIDPNGSVGFDNHGSLNIEGIITIAGLLKIPIGSEGEGCQTFSAFPSGGVSCLTNSDGIAIVDYIVTMQQGDNFTVAASTDENYIGGISGDGINLKDSSNTQIPTTTTNVNACENSSVKACRTDMLTVWRSCISKLIRWELLVVIK